MPKPRLSPEALAYLAACQRDLLDEAAQKEREIEDARRHCKAAMLDQFVAWKRGSEGFEH